MLDEFQIPGRRRARASLALSFCLHLVIVAVLMHRPAPVILKHEASLRGNGGNAISLVAPGYSVVHVQEIEQKEELQKDQFSLRKVSHKRKAPEKPLMQAASKNAPLAPGMPGYVLGSLTSGFILNHDVKVALPVVAPDPPIVRNKLPEWISGDVIVEVTIDEQGHVIETVVLKTVGFGLDQTIVETLRNWHFTPAMVDGIKVASKQDVHFHFPS